MLPVMIGILVLLPAVALLLLEMMLVPVLIHLFIARLVELVVALVALVKEKE